MQERLLRLFLPDIFFAQGKKRDIKSTLLPKAIWLYLFLVAMYTFTWSVNFTFYATGFVCLLIIAASGSRFNFKPEQLAYLRTMPFSALDYVQGRFLWSVIFGLASTAVYILTFWLMREDLSLTWGLEETLSFVRILGFGLAHFSMLVLTFSLTTLIRTRLSTAGVFWILLALLIGEFVLTLLDAEAYLFGRVFIHGITFPVSLLVLLVALMLAGVCYWGTINRLNHWVIPIKSPRWKRALIGFGIAATAVLVCVFLPKAWAYRSPVDERLTPEAQYQVALDCLEDGDIYGAAVSFYACEDYGDARERCWELWGKLVPRQTIDVSYDHVLALTNDGTFLTTDTEGTDFPMIMEDIPDADRLISIHYGGDYLAGLYDDGTVGVWGDFYEDGIAETSQWTDIVGLFVASDFDNRSYIIGLKADGTVVVSGRLPENIREEVLGWKNLIDLDSDPGGRFIGVHSDGTMTPSHISRYGAVLLLGRARSVGCGNGHTAILHEDGTVTSLGHGGWKQINTQDWTDVVAIETSWCCTVGLRSDGKVLMAGGLVNAPEFPGEEALVDWTDIVDVAISGKLLVGLRSDGTLVVTGDAASIQEAISGWENIRVPG